MLVALAVTVSSAAQLSKIDKEYTKSDENGKLRELYNRMADLDGRGDSDILIYSNQAGKEMEKYADAGSGLAVCHLAHFYGPQVSNERYHENFNLSLKWLIVGEIRGLNCEIGGSGVTFVDGEEPEGEYDTSLKYLMEAIKLNVSPKEIKKNIPYYYKAQQWLIEKKHLENMPKAVK